jgi:hypothetical protein
MAADPERGAASLRRLRAPEAPLPAFLPRKRLISRFSFIGRLRGAARLVRSRQHTRLALRKAPMVETVSAQRSRTRYRGTPQCNAVILTETEEIAI